ncbi:hypothetical protein LCGC14_0360130 [marine sediment metagenome]|uniref:Uncharacterized protein n=1 Tax=marine sediment metagenome TaxID=412755 RepID=A0A0F9TE39_9ZZZZ
MYWDKKSSCIYTYELVSCNQHGERFKRTTRKQLSVAHINCKLDDAVGMSELILLSHTLDVPVRYDFDEQRAYIEVVSNEALKECLQWE